MTLFKRLFIGTAGFIGLALGMVHSVFAGGLSITSNHPHGVYHVGDTVHWRIFWRGSKPPPVADYKVLRNDLTDIGHGTLAFHDNASTVDARFTTPGSLLLVVTGKSLRCLGGAIAAPESIKPAAPCPSDFWSFWNQQIAALNQIKPPKEIVILPHAEHPGHKQSASVFQPFITIRQKLWLPALLRDDPVPIIPGLKY